MNLYEGRKSKEEQVPEGEQKLETTTRGIQAALKRSQKADKKEKEKKLKSKLRKKELKLRAASEQRKKEYFDWQKRQAERRAGSSKLSISVKDTDATATDKIVGRLAGALSSPEVRDFAKSQVKKRVIKPLSTKTETGKLISKGFKGSQTNAKRLEKVKSAGKGGALRAIGARMRKDTPKVPLIQRPGFRNFARAIKTDVKTGIGKIRSNRPPTSSNKSKPTTPPSTPSTTQSAPTPSNAPKSKRGRILNFLQRRSKLGEGYFGTDYFNNYLIENYSCWKEEFLMELGEMRKKVKEKKEIDVMRGKNKVTLSPTVSEDYRTFEEEMNGASIFAKATPPLKKRTTPISDIVLSKQPGKGTAEKVRDKMSRLFMGDIINYYPNYDLSGHKTDDNNMDSTNR